LKNVSKYDYESKILTKCFFALETLILLLN